MENELEKLRSENAELRTALEAERKAREEAQGEVKMYGEMNDEVFAKLAEVEIKLMAAEARVRELENKHD